MISAKNKVLITILLLVICLIHTQGHINFPCFRPSGEYFFRQRKLQKLLYYSQGLHLAIFNEKLFDDEIEAWTHGPVVPSVYHEYKEYGNNIIPRPESIDFKKYKKKEIHLFLDEVYAVYGQFSAWKLRNMTHNEPPWKDTRVGKNISTKKLKNYFKTQVEEDKDDG
jgi:uncharacterized phage-associated protein